MSYLGSDATSASPRMVLLVYVVVQTQYTKLLLEDICNAEQLDHRPHGVANQKNDE
jgi:hypothetical protein